MKKSLAKDGSVLNWLTLLKTFINHGKISAKSVVLNNEMQSLVKTGEKVDVIIMGFGESPILFGIAKELKAPVVLTCTIKLFYMVEHFTGAFAHDSFISSPLLSVTNEMTYKDRVLNTITNWAGRFFIKFLYLTQESTFNELFPAYSFWETISNSVQLMLLNSHFSIDQPMPYMTNMIEVSGMQIPDFAEPLPDSLKKFIESANEGVVYFCMGGTLKMKDLDSEKKSMIIDNLKKVSLPIVIKWDDDTTIDQFTPKEQFYVSKWLPQNDILAHPNVKVYVTHGGLLSTTEAIYHGVPIIGMPIFGDQRSNLQRFIKLKIAIQVEYDNLTSESLATAINSVIEDKTYDKTAKELSVRFRDRPMTPVQTAKYWVEYVIRHRNREFMRSPAMKLSMIEYFNLDVYLTLLSVILIVIYIGWILVKCIIGKVYSMFFKKEKEKKS